MTGRYPAARVGAVPGNSMGVEDVGIAELLQAVGRARVTMVIGASDTGKTTLTALLAGALAERGETVAVVDADVGQSEIGPPTTVGLGRVRGPLFRLGAAEVLALEFVGTTSPARAVRPIAQAAGALVERARGDAADRILVDTSGLVAGPLGRWLKRAKIEAVRPDLVVTVTRGGEDPYLAREALAYGGCPVRCVAAAAGARRRRQDERRRHRARVLAAYLAGASSVTLATGPLPVRRLDRSGARPLGPDDADILVGVHDAEGRTLGVGRVVDVDAHTVTIATPVAAGLIAAITAGRERVAG